MSIEPNAITNQSKPGLSVYVDADGLINICWKRGDYCHYISREFLENAIEEALRKAG